MASTSLTRTLEGRLRLALELFDDGVAMKRLSLARQHPDEDDTQIRRRMVRWMRGHPGHGGRTVRPPHR